MKKNITLEFETEEQKTAFYNILTYEYVNTSYKDVINKIYMEVGINKVSVVDNGDNNWIYLSK